MAMLDRGKCPSCGSPMKEFDHWVSRCVSCNFWRSSLSPGIGRGVDGLESLRTQNFIDLFDQLESHANLDDKRILEVGCGAGWFMDEARRRSFSAIAIEPDEVSAIVVRERGHEVRVGLFPDALVDGEKFDLIVFNDVFEHLEDPALVTRTCANHLHDGGLLVINLPNAAGVGFQAATIMYRMGITGLFERLWQKGFASPHLTYFDPNSLRNVIEKEDFVEVMRFSLASVALKGLWARIRSKSSVPAAIVTYGAGVISLPLLKLAPSDIHVGVFRKESGASA